MIAKNVAFICGSVLAVTIILTVWDEDVLNVEHLLTVMTVLGAAVAGARVFIPDENLVFCPEKTLTQVYSQESWERLSERIVRIRIFSGDCSHPLLPPAVERSSTHLPGLFKTGHNCHVSTKFVSGDDRIGPAFPLHGPLPPRRAPLTRCHPPRPHLWTQPSNSSECFLI